MLDTSHKRVSRSVQNRGCPPLGLLGALNHINLYHTVDFPFTNVGHILSHDWPTSITIRVPTRAPLDLTTALEQQI